MLTIYHNPRCSKSRSALALLQKRGVSLRIVEYLKTPPAAAELEAILAAIGEDVRSIIRKGEDAYKALNLGDESLSRASLVRAIVENPILLERPIVVKDGKGVVGRPPEKVLDLL